MAPPAPTLFSTTKGWPRISCKRSETMRAWLSVLPPATKGTITLTGFCGQDCAFAGDVMQEERHAFQRRTRGEIDDAAITALPHVRHAGAAAEENAERVDLHHLAPFGRRNLLEWAQRNGAEEGGIVDQDVE